MEDSEHKLATKKEEREPDPFSSDYDKARRMPPVQGEVTNVEYQCPVCRQVFTNREELEEHKKSHANVEQRIEDQGATGIS